MSRGNNNDELDNKKIFSRIVSLRVEKANLLGYKRYADLVLQRKMAKTPENVFKLLNDMWIPTTKKGITTCHVGICLADSTPALCLSQIEPQHQIDQSARKKANVPRAEHRAGAITEGAHRWLVVAHELARYEEDHHDQHADPQVILTHPFPPDRLPSYQWIARTCGRGPRCIGMLQ